MVGAPLGNKTSPTNERNRFGSVYRCRSGTPSCEVITIDDSGELFEVTVAISQFGVLNPRARVEIKKSFQLS